MSEDWSRETIIDQVSCILASPDFSAGPRVQKFLSHIVTEELDGRGELLKGTALAMDLFGRGVDFDPNSDPVVRIEAIKLRKALERYYLTGGAADQLIIEVPKGAYRPLFKRAEAAVAPKLEPIRAGLPTLGIHPFEGASSEKALLYREGLPEEIALELARFGQIRVLSNWFEQGSGNAATNKGTVRCDYALRGNVREANGDLRVSVQLTRVSDETLIWSDRFLFNADNSNAFAMQEDIARKCATRLADAYGAVPEDLNAQYSGRRAADAGVFEALLSFHAHMRTCRNSSLKEFRELASEALRDNPSSGLAHALLAIVLVEAVSFGQATTQEVLEPGRIHAEKAIALSPHCQEALFVAAAFAHTNNDQARYRNLITRAVEANPNGTLLMALAGGWLAKTGDMERGLKMVHDARDRNPLLPVWTIITLAMDPMVKGNYQEASDLVRHVDARDCVYDWLFIAVAHLLAGDLKSGDGALKQFAQRQIDPVDYAASIPMEANLRLKIDQAIDVARENALL